MWVRGTIGKDKEEKCLYWETEVERGTKKTKLEGRERERGSCQPLESEFEKLSSIFAILRPVVEGKGSAAYRDRT